jgi:hypothetical protein
MKTDGLIALVAVILAAGAFIVAFLQVLLEYMSSSASRDLCSFSAIGPTSNQKKYGWNFSAWKLRVYYPLIKMDCNTLLQEFVKSGTKNIEVNETVKSIQRNHNWVWRVINSDEIVHRNDIAFVAPPRLIPSPMADYLQ